MWKSKKVTKKWENIVKRVKRNQRITKKSEKVMKI